jgi:NIMA (never in mitosis gene a)-related kinase
MAENDEPQIYKKRYKVDKKLGAGNFGTAYLVTDLKAKHEPYEIKNFISLIKVNIFRKVLKVVRLGEMDADQTVDSVREAELLANLDNEYIVKVRNKKKKQKKIHWKII